MDVGGEGSGTTVWYGLGGRQPLVTKTPMEISMIAAARRAVVKPARALSAKQLLAKRKAEVAALTHVPPRVETATCVEMKRRDEMKRRVEMKRLGGLRYDSYLRFGG